MKPKWGRGSRRNDEENSLYVHCVPFFDIEGKGRKFREDEAVEEGFGPRPPLSAF